METLALIDPSIAEGLLTFLAAIVASGTALWISTHVYVRQKSIDAKNLLSVEKRNAFRSFFASASELQSELRGLLHRGVSSDQMFERAELSLHDLFRDFEALGLSSDKQTLDCCRKYVDSLIGLREHTEKSLYKTEVNPRNREIEGAAKAIELVLEARDRSLALARAEILGQSEASAQNDLVGLFKRNYSTESLGEVVSRYEDERSRHETENGQ